jgi:hypothetical protein
LPAFFHRERFVMAQRVCLDLDLDRTRGPTWPVIAASLLMVHAAMRPEFVAAYDALAELRGHRWFRVRYALSG